MKHVRVIKVVLGLILIFSGIAKLLDPSKAVDLMLEFEVIPEFIILLIMLILDNNGTVKYWQAFKSDTKIDDAYSNFFKLLEVIS